MIISLSSLHTLTLAVTVTMLAATPGFAAHLTESDFQSSISKGLWLVEFYSPYCSHCKRLAPTWNKVAEERAPLAAISGFNMAQVDCVAQGDLCNSNKITGYPQMMLFQDGKKTGEYLGNRSHDDLTSFIDKHIAEYTKSSASEPVTSSTTDTPHLNPDDLVSVLTPENFEKTLAAGATFIKFCAPWSDFCQKLAPVWVELASKTEGRPTIAEVNCVHYRDLCESQGVEGYPMLVFYNAGQKVEFIDQRNIELLEQFVLRVVSPGSQQPTANEGDMVGPRGGEIEEVDEQVLLFT